MFNEFGNIASIKYNQLPVTCQTLRLSVTSNKTVWH